MLGSSTTTNSFSFAITPTITALSSGTDKTKTTFSFGQPQPSTGFTSTQPSTAATTVAAATAAAATATTQAPAPTSSSDAPSSSSHYRLLEDSVNHWKGELEELERNIINQATQVDTRDRLLLANAERVAQLNGLVERAQLDQQRLDHELDYVASQQAELERLLEPLESAMRTTPALSVQQHANLEREHTYHLADDVSSELSGMSRDIRDIVEQLNAASASAAQGKPLQQISKVLNSHMDALMWIQHNADQMKQKIQDMERTFQE
uniref:Putative nuclear pore glycoprotein p62 ixodes scapularis nuclear pore glycoprotein p62 n=1 Tax=Amblyomma triste TaxID=251400 RepID=A0A023GC68_AMBTT